jgi:putative ABC transport system substrate-binding protein
LVPNAHTIALLVNPNDNTTEAEVTDVQAAARELSQKIIVLTAAAEGDIEAAFATLVQDRASALIVSAGAFFVTRANKIIGLAAQHAMPTMYSRRDWAAAGGLMSYGSNPTETYRQLGIYAGRILSGDKPAHLPVVQSTKFEFILNLKTAKTLGLAIPPGLLAIADEVIE